MDNYLEAVARQRELAAMTSDELRLHHHLKRATYSRPIAISPSAFEQYVDAYFADPRRIRDYMPPPVNVDSVATTTRRCRVQKTDDDTCAKTDR